MCNKATKRKLFLQFTKRQSKLDEHGKPIYREDGKVLKGLNYGGKYWLKKKGFM